LWRCIHGHDALILQKKGKMINEKYVSFIPEYLDLCKERGIRKVDDLDITWLKEEYLEVCAGEETKTTVVGMTATRCHAPHLMWDREWFEHPVKLPFENTTVNCPGEYEKVLEREYGDWRTPVMGSSEHEMFAVDTETPWKSYLKDL
ncbi:MAG TPA: LicD family protein, partial [Lachnospiraceae bacterium]|nr:LicD family protein [Lachnospiraceae bacterium]